MAPVEDLVLSIEDFEALCNEGLLKPHARNLAVKPHLRLWGQTRVSGHVEIAGFLSNSILRLATAHLQSPGPLSEDDQKKKVLDQIERTLPQYLKKKFPDAEVTVSPATVLHHSRG